MSVYRSRPWRVKARHRRDRAIASEATAFATAHELAGLTGGLVEVARLGPGFNTWTVHPDGGVSFGIENARLQECAQIARRHNRRPAKEGAL